MSGVTAVVSGSPALGCVLIGEVLGARGMHTDNQADVEVVLGSPADLVARRSDLPIVLVTDDPLDDDDLLTAVANGANALVDRASEPDVLIRAVELVAAGEPALTSVQSFTLLRAMRAHLRGQEQHVLLTARETEILRSVQQGESVKQTAHALGISTKTVENTQRHLFSKLGVRNRSEAVARAFGLGLLDKGV
jgi:DNA-binding NarL/FixJ family response regulator